MKTVTVLTKIPSDADDCIFLIKQELKSRKLFRLLEQIGVNECTYEPHMDVLILKNLGLDDGKDETFALYNVIMEKRTHKLKETNDSLTKQAFRAYVELVNEKRKRKDQ